MQNNELQLDEALLYRNPRAAIALLNDTSNELDRPTQIKLTYVRMISLSLDQLLELLEDSLLIPYDLPDFLLTEMITKYIESDLNVKNESELLLKLKEIIEKNQESIGSKELNLAGKKVPPTTQNWISDYNAYYVTGNENHDPLNQIKYINSSENIKGLDEKSKAILLDILKLYDRSVSFTKLWNSIEVTDNVGQIFQETDITQFLPDLEEESSSPSPEQQLVTEEPALAPAQVAQDIQPERVVQNNTPSVGVDTQQAKIDRNLYVDADSEDFKIPQLRDLDLSRQAKRGLVFDEPTNIDLTEVAKRREEELKKQKAIDEKLNALKQRKQK
ncbi:MAG TPA: hypothetical protein PKD34_00735 [Candidatus Doudnabacteria bacterium]|nr:hypothetical protein [Candidatus Doudnabacteria bacterium]